MQQDYELKWPGLPIKFLIISTDDYIVFVDNENFVDWKTTDDFKIKDIEKHNEVLNKGAFIESVPCDHFPDNVVINFKRLIGEAFARSFDHDYENAKLMLEYADNYIKARNSEESRFWYLTSSGIATLVFVICGIFTWIFRDAIIQVTGKFAVIVFLASVAGSLGALLSVIMRMGNTHLDCAAGKKLHYIEGLFKIISGAIAAILLALAVNAEIIVPAFSKLNKTYLAMIIVGFIAGASERWAPSIISKIDGGNNNSFSKDKHKKEKLNEKKDLDTL